MRGLRRRFVGFPSSLVCLVHVVLPALLALVLAERLVLPMSALQ